MSDPAIIIPPPIPPLMGLIIYWIESDLSFLEKSLAQEESIIALYYYDKEKSKKRIKDYYSYLRKGKKIIAKNIFAVITCKNEGTILKTTISECKDALTGLKSKGKIDNFEIRIMESLKTDDKTIEIANKLESESVIADSSHFEGQGAGWMKAMNELKGNNRDGVLLFIDGDGQYPPADIPKYLIPILEGDADMVIGTKYFPLDQDSTKKATEKAFDDNRRQDEKNWVKLANKELKTNFTDLQSGIKAIRLDAIGYENNCINLNEFKNKIYNVSLHEAFCVKAFNNMEIVLECPVSAKKSRPTSLDLVQYKKSIDSIMKDLLALKE